MNNDKAVEPLAVEIYHSPIGPVYLISNAAALLGLFLANSPLPKSLTTPLNLPPNSNASALMPSSTPTPPLTLAKQWLSEYFAGQIPTAAVPIKLIGTPFQLRVWQILQTIPYGATLTYGEIARQLDPTYRLSAQAVGGAVGRNPISLIIPCHRVLGHNRTLTGYAAGLDIKAKLLSIEGIKYKNRDK